MRPLVHFSDNTPPESNQLVMADGHGMYGPKIVSFISEYSTKTPIIPLDDYFQGLEDYCRPQLHDHVFGTTPFPLEEEEGAIYVKFGGPIRGGASVTALSINRDTGDIHVGNVGSIKLMVFDETSMTTMTEDHTPMNLSEFTRIHEIHPETAFLFADKEGRVSSRPRPVFVQDHVNKWIVNPSGGLHSCSIKGEWSSYVSGGFLTHQEYTGVTRSIGDYNLKRHGLSAKPAKSHLPPPSIGTTRAIVMGNDLFWNAIPVYAINAIVRNDEWMETMDATTVAHRLAIICQRAHRNIFDTDIDLEDIAISVIYIFMPSETTDPSDMDAVD